MLKYEPIQPANYSLEEGIFWHSLVTIEFSTTGRYLLLCRRPPNKTFPIEDLRAIVSTYTVYSYFENVDTCIVDSVN